MFSHIGVVPKRNNKFSYYIVSTVHRSHLIALITKAIDQLSTFMVMLLDGRDLQIFVYKKLDPSSLKIKIRWLITTNDLFCVNFIVSILDSTCISTNSPI